MKKEIYEALGAEFPAQSSIKLMKNTKGYNWEIKVYCDDLEKAEQSVADMNKKLKEKYGSQED